MAWISLIQLLRWTMRLMGIAYLSLQDQPKGGHLPGKSGSLQTWDPHEAVESHSQTPLRSGWIAGWTSQ